MKAYLKVYLYAMEFFTEKKKKNIYKIKKCFKVSKQIDFAISHKMNKKKIYESNNFFAK